MVEYVLVEGGILMKNIKKNEKLVTRIVSGGLSLVLVASGFALGKLDSKNNNSSKDNNASSDEFVNEYLEDYITKRSTLEQEIENLLKQKEELQDSKTFDIEDLIVIEHTKADGQSNLFILYSSGIDGIYHEYHKNFSAWYRLHDDTEEHVYDFCPEYVHFNEGEPLFNYLTDEEIEKITSNGGKTTILDLDQILNRMRNEYQEQLSQKTCSRSLTNN